MESLNKIIEKKIQEDNDRPRQRSGCYNPSKFGHCYRLQYWNRQNLPPTNPVDIKIQKKGIQGKATHKMIQSCLPEVITEVEVREDDVLGYADIKWGKVFDIKCQEDYQIKRFWKIPIELAIKSHYSAFLQVVYYGSRLDTAYVAILPCAFGTFPTLEHCIKVSDWLDDIECELYHLRMYWDLGLPPAEPRAYGGKECNYCSQRERCLEVELCQAKSTTSQNETISRVK